MRTWSSSQVRTLLSDIWHSWTDKVPTGNLKAVVLELVCLASDEEDYYGNGNASTMVFKPSTYFTIGYTTLTGTNREPEGGCPQGGASGPKPKPMPNVDADLDEDHYGNGNADATVCKLSTYLTIGYVALIGTNREPEDSQSYVGASGPQTQAHTQAQTQCRH